MTLDPVVLLTILAMAAVTYAARAGGYMVATRLPMGAFARRFMANVPGATFAALIAPAVLTGGALEWTGVVVTAAVARYVGHPLAAIAAGVLIVALGRQAGIG